MENNLEEDDLEDNLENNINIRENQPLEDEEMMNVEDFAFQVNKKKISKKTKKKNRH